MRMETILQRASSANNRRTIDGHFESDAEPGAEIPLINEALSAARRIITKNVSDKGLAASIDNYPQVWTRDTVIAFLGGALDNGEFMKAFKLSLETLVSFQDEFGQIPFLVQIKDGHAGFGSVDSNPWFVIGACYYAELSKDSEWFLKYAPAIIKALKWCESRDFRKTGLLESGECDDWADLLSNRGQVLFPNVLYAFALSKANCLFGECGLDYPEMLRRSSQVQEAIQTAFWVSPVGTFTDLSHSQVRTHMSVTLRKRPYFMPWVNHGEYGERFDTAANLLAILSGVASPEQSETILHYIQQAGLNRPYPVRVLYPPIQPGERDWRDYYKVWGNNLPDQYHNGGIWPWVGGLYIAALVHRKHFEKAASEFVRLARANEKGLEQWEYNEWLHGISGEAMGAKYQAWSAGMFLFAHECLQRREVPCFSTTATSFLWGGK